LLSDQARSTLLGLTRLIVAGLLLSRVLLLLLATGLTLVIARRVSGLRVRRVGFVRVIRIVRVGHDKSSHRVIEALVSIVQLLFNRAPRGMFQLFLSTGQKPQFQELSAAAARAKTVRKPLPWSFSLFIIRPSVPGEENL